MASVSGCTIASMLIPLLVFAMASAGPSPESRGLILFQQCKTNVRMLDNNAAGATFTDYQNAASCMAYFDGFTDAYPDGLFCLGTATLGTVSRVYVAYMEKHPKLMDEHRSEGVRQALSDSYPCSVGRK